MSVNVESLVPIFVDRLVDSKIVEKIGGKVEWVSRELKFDNYTSQIIKLTVKHPKPGKPSLHFVIKIPNNSRCYDIFKTLPMYDNEVYMYEKILPRMTEMMAPGEKNYFAPRFFGTDGGQVILLDNLERKGYHPTPRWGVLGKRSLTKAVEKLAEFHACSVKINETEPALLDRFRKIMLPASKLATPAQFGARLEMILRLHLPNFDKYADQCKKFAPTFFDQIMKEMDPSRNKFNVLTYGHLHMDNVLIKRELDEEIQDIKIVGYQCLNFSHPVLDLIYLTLSSSTHGLFKNHCNEVVGHYHATLIKTLKKLNCETKVDYTVDDLVASFKKKTIFCLFVVTFVQSFFRTSDYAAALDLTQEEPVNGLLYHKLVGPWLEYLVEKKEVLNRV